MSRDYPITKDESRWIALWKQHGGSQHGPNVEHVTMPYEAFFGFCKAMEESLAVDPVLKSADGAFSCVGSLAVEDAYLMGTATAALDKAPLDALPIGEVLCGYASGDSTVEEARQELMEWLDDGATAKS